IAWGRVSDSERNPRNASHDHKSQSDAIDLVAKRRHSIAWGRVSDSERNPRNASHDPKSRKATA
ncbi:MAG: hypothetical protein ACOVLE_00420, partial [Pirellula staleyi]